MRKLFKRTHRAEVEKIEAETAKLQDKRKKVDKIYEETKHHLKQNNFGPRLYAQMVQNWK